MKRIRLLAITNTTLLIIHISISYLTQTGLITKYNIRQVSDKFQTYFTPAGFTFAIWGLIYIALAGFVAFHLVKAFREDHKNYANEELELIGWNFAINNLATIGWLFAWTNEKLLWSLILIIIQLVTLIIIHHKLRIHNAHATLLNKIFTQFPLSIYFAWICIATIANTAIYLTSIGWNGWGISAVNWSITLIAISVMLAVWVINRKRNVFFGLVIIWALYGIMSRGRQVGSVEYEPIILVASVGMGIIALACMFGLIRNLQIQNRHHVGHDIENPQTQLGR
jgi:hypothetical protein